MIPVSVNLTAVLPPGSLHVGCSLCEVLNASAMVDATHHTCFGYQMDFASLCVSETNLIAGFRHGTCSSEKLSCE